MHACGVYGSGCVHCNRLHLLSCKYFAFWEQGPYQSWAHSIKVEGLKWDSSSYRVNKRSDTAIDQRQQRLQGTTG
uniref:SJCHGC07629 protein n=1 Tax=Schistosoma japonicum TaxID=6182 RepID=Q5BRR3_SCHJA|nr:SJCHGC07629 protein [Schistosoma japonicum]